MRNVIISSLLALLLINGPCVFAQSGLMKQLAKTNKMKLKPQVELPRANRLVPTMPGVFIPHGTTIGQLESEIQRTALAAGVEVNPRLIACNPQLLRQFEQTTGRHVFGTPALPYEEGLNVLQNNQAGFAQARANGEFEGAWEEFQAEKQSKLAPYYQNIDANLEEFYAQGGDMFQNGKVYTDPTAMALDVYNFHMQKLHTQQVPQVRLTVNNFLPQGVYEIPVSGLKLLMHDTEETIKDISPENFVVLANPMGKAHLVFRKTLEAAEEGEPVTYEVVEPVTYTVVK